MPTLIEVDSIRRALAVLTPGDPVRHGQLTVVPGPRTPGGSRSPKQGRR